MSTADDYAPELRRINSTKLVEKTVSAMREQILAGNYEPDQILPSQAELCDELGVSRSVVREAMRTLQSQGLIEVSQGRRPSVRPAGPQAVIETLAMLVQRSQISLGQLLEVRRPLEIEIAALAALNRSEEHVAQLQIAVDQLRDAADLKSQVAADSRFHQVLAEASGNPLFGIVLDVLAGLLHESRQHTMQQSGVETALAYHQQILAAVAAGDCGAARKSMLQHMEQTKIDIEATL